MIKLQNINKSYRKLQVLNNLNFELQKGDYISIIGKSGCGKSTLLNILAGIDTPNSGDFYFEEEKMPVNTNKLSW